MANPIIGEKMSEKSGARDTAAPIQGSSDRFSREMSSEQDALLGKAKQVYGMASGWITENLSGRTLGVVGLVAAAGILGFFVGRSNSRSQAHSMIDMETY